MSTVLVVTADLQGDPAGLIKAFRDAVNASEEFKRKTEQDSQRSSSVWKRFADDAAGVAGSIRGFGDSTIAVGQKLTDNITKPAGIAVAAIGSIAAFGGWNRLVAIENAEKQIQSLNYTAEEAAAIINTDVLAAVEGTAFSLAEAGTQAGAALAAGIAPGQALTDQLRLIADATTRSNTDFASMSQMLLRVEGSGKLTGDMLERFTENGLFVLPMLQKEFGKTADEIRDMVSRGEIDSATFARVLEENVGGAALLSGDTAAGAFANMRTALSNLGATALKEVFPLIKDSMMELTALMKSPEFKESAAAIGTAIADAFRTVSDVVSNVVGWFSQLDPAWQQVVIGLVAGAVAIGPVLILVGKIAVGISALVGAFGVVSAAIQGWKLAAAGAAAAQGALTGATAAQSAALRVGAVAQAAFNAVMNANPIFLVITAIAALVAGLVWFFTQTELGREIWANFTSFLTDAWNNIVSVATTVWGAISSFFTDTWNNIVSVVTTVWDTISGYIGAGVMAVQIIWNTVWGAISSFFQETWNGIVAFFTPIFEVIGSIIQFGVEAWTNIFLIFAAVLVTVWQWISDGVTTAWNAIVEFLTPIITAIVDFIVAYFTSMFEFWSGVWNGVVSIVTTVWNAIVAFLTPIVTAIASFIQTTIGAVASWWNTTWAAVSAFFMGVWNAIVAFVSPIVASISNAVMSTFNALSSWWNGIWSAISSFFSTTWNNMVNGVQTAVNTVSNIVGTIYDTVMGVFSDIGSWLVSAGSDLIRGFWNGISDMAGWIQSKIGGFFDGIVGWAKDVLGIASPSRVMMEVGYDTGRGVGVGLEQSARIVREASVNLIPQMPDSRGLAASFAADFNRSLGDAKALTSTWDAANGTGTYGTPPWVSASPGNVDNSRSIKVDIKVEGGNYPDVDALADAVSDRLAFSIGGEVDPE